MALSDLAVFSEYAYSSMTEVLDQQVQLFNGASQGTIILRSQAHQGDFSDLALFAKVAGLVRRRNAYGAGAVAEKTLQQLIDTSVKVAAGTPPVNISPSQFKWIQQNPEVAGATIGKQLAEDTLGDMLNTAVLAAVAALGNVAAVKKDITATGKASIADLVATAGLFGDRAAAIRAWVLHSKPLFDIYATAIANAQRLFVFGNVQVSQDGFGRIFVVTDSPSLVKVDGGGVGVNWYYSLGLVQGAILCDQNGDFTDNTIATNGDENIKRTYQAEWSYNIGLKGFAWDKTNGGKSPNDAALGTATNWDQYATYDKDLAGVMLVSQ